MERACILAIDLGTSGPKVALVTTSKRRHPTKELRMERFSSS
jgi:sugar (pentulose or hexulose) kinase